MKSVSPRPTAPTLELGDVFDAHFAYVWRSLRRLGATEADAEDLVHEVFLRLHRRMADYQPDRSLRAWIFGFTYRVAADHRRLARHRREVVGLAVEPMGHERPADEGIERREQRVLVEEALTEVEVERRAVLLMHDVDEIPVPEIARELEIPLNTAYSRLRLARRDLAAAVTRLRKERGEP